MVLDPGDRSRLDPDDRALCSRDERRLFERYQRTGDPAARAELTERFLPLARSLARRYERGGEPLDDLTQVASLALLKVIDRFDAQRPVAFTSYAVPTIVGELKRYFRDYGWSVRVPRSLQELALCTQRESDRLTAERGHAPTAAQLAQRLGVDVEQILEAREAMGAHRAASLDRPREDADDHELPVRELGVEDPGFAAAEDAATVSQLTASLTQYERKVLRLRFEEDLTQSQIAARIGCSQMHVSRVLRGAIGRVQERNEAQLAA